MDAAAAASADDEPMELTTVATTARDADGGSVNSASPPASPTMQGSWQLTKSWCLVADDDELDGENPDALLGVHEAEEELFSHGRNLPELVPLSTAVKECHFGDCKDGHASAAADDDDAAFACSHTPPKDDGNIYAREQLDTFETWRDDVPSSASPVLVLSEERASDFDYATIKKPTVVHVGYSSGGSSAGSTASFNDNQGNLSWIAKIWDDLTRTFKPLNDYLVPLVLSHVVTLFVGVYVGRSSSYAMPTKADHAKQRLIGQAVAACL